MRRIAISLTLSALLLSACGQGQEAYLYEDDSPPAPVAYDVSVQELSARKSPDPQGGQIAAASPLMAYRYTYGMTLPSSNVESAMTTHMERCVEAGPTQCHVLNSNTQTGNEDYASAYLSLRASSDWLNDFQSGLDTGLEDMDGRVTDRSVSAEDLTRQIFDADARLKAQMALRDRLLGLLETRDAELEGLLALEREIARVQSEIESGTAWLKSLRQRVSMSVVDLRYQSRARAVSQSSFSPVFDALRGFVRTVAQGMAAVIGFIALALPWILFILLPALLLFRWIRRRRIKPKNPAAQDS